jgi:hypothetical protein
MNTYENNQVKSYAVIWERCTCRMKQKIDSRVELLYHKKFKNDMEQIGFKISPYNPCVANRMVNGSQNTIT